MRALQSLAVSVVSFLILVMVFSGSAESATLRRVPGAYLLGPETVYTNGTQADFFIPISDPMPSRNLMAGRVTMEVTEVTSNNIKMRPALRWSADGVTWDSSSYINVNYVTGAGNQATSTFTDFSSLGTPKPFVQFGVQTYTITGSTFELARVALLVEPKAPQY